MSLLFSHTWWSLQLSSIFPESDLNLFCLSQSQHSLCEVSIPAVRLSVDSAVWADLNWPGWGDGHSCCAGRRADACSFLGDGTIGSPFFHIEELLVFSRAYCFPAFLAAGCGPVTKFWPTGYNKGFCRTAGPGSCLLPFSALASSCCLEHKYHSRSSNLCLAAFSRFSKNRS